MPQRMVHAVWHRIKWPLYYLVGLWCCGALWFAFFSGIGWRILFLGIFLAVWQAAPWLNRRFRYNGRIAAGLELAVILWFWSLTPTNDKEWKPSFARNPVVLFNQPRPGWVTIHNIRDFNYRSVDDFDVRYSDGVYDLNTVTGVDFIVVHWGMEAIAHTMLSFGFEDGRHLALSVETRVPEGADGGTLPGIYKQYNLLMILGTERDLFALRTNYRHEDLYLYKTTTLPFEARQLLAWFLQEINELERHPRFYNTVTANCTNTLTPSLRRVWNFESARSALLNGWVDEMSFNAGWLEAKPGESFADLKRRSYANPKVDSFAGLPEDYSERIRQR